MVITYQGGNYFKFQSGDTVVLVDPDNQRSFKGAVLVLNTLSPASTNMPAESEANAPFWIEHPGEYEVKDVEIHGWNSGYEKGVAHAVYRFTMDEITVGILGHLSKELDEKLHEELGGLDILIVPAGGKPYLAETAIAKLVRELEPAMVIPSLTKDTKPFLKALGQSTCTPEEKIVLKKKDLTPGALVVKCLAV